MIFQLALRATSLHCLNSRLCLLLSWYYQNIVIVLFYRRYGWNNANYVSWDRSYMFLDIFIKSMHTTQWDISNPTKAFHTGDISWSTIVWAMLQYSLWNEIQISPPSFSHIKWCTMPGGYLWIFEDTFIPFGCEPQISLLREAQREIHTVV